MPLMMRSAATVGVVFATASKRSIDCDRRALSVREVAARLGVSEWLIEKAIRNGTLASVKLGARRLIPVDAVEELLAQAYARTTVAATSTSSRDAIDADASSAASSAVPGA